MEVIIGLGSNIGDRLSYLEEAVQALATVHSLSAVYETSALGLDGDVTSSQAPYLNAVAILSTEKNPLEFLELVLGIESRLGRERAGVPFQSRTIDLDILGIEDSIIDSIELKVPHPELPNRDFVLRPMMDVCPNWEHPRLGKTVTELSDELEVKISEGSRPRCITSCVGALVSKNKRSSAS